MGSVEINISDENLFDEQYIRGYFTNDSGSTNTASDGARADNYIIIGDNKTIYVLFKCLKVCTLARFWIMEFDENYNAIKRTSIGIYDTSFNVGNIKKQVNLSQNCRYIKPSFYGLRDGDSNTLLTYDKFNEYFDISVSRNEVDDYIKHQSQTAIMPIQQEMLEGDYVADVEHHEWGKYMLTGNETNISRGNSINGITQFNIAKIVYKNPNTEEITAKSNYFLGVKWDKSWTIDNCICNVTDGYSIRIMTSEYTTVEDFKIWLKSKYDEGSPVIIYYKLAEPIDLELTEEQKAVRKQKMYTYKNITNISLSDELASIDVEYKKDLETEHNKLQNEIDEIKQLISTTETSALLLDNLQKDVESEVE